MKPLEHRVKTKTDADAERIGFLIELHCVLEWVLQCCSITKRIQKRIPMVSWPLRPMQCRGCLRSDLREPNRVEQ